MMRSSTATAVTAAVLAGGLAFGATACTDDESEPPVTVATTTTTEVPGARDTQPDGSPQIPESEDDPGATPGDTDQPEAG